MSGRRTFLATPAAALRFGLGRGPGAFYGQLDEGIE